MSASSGFHFTLCHDLLAWKNSVCLFFGFMLSRRAGKTELLPPREKVLSIGDED